jgi:hypothetical protein
MFIFTEKECDYIKSFWNDEYSNNGTSGRQIILKNGETTTLRRHSGNKVSFFDITDTNILSLFKQKLKPHGIKNIEKVKLMKYVVGDMIKPHNDLYQDNYKTLIVQLSNSNEYKGGNLLIEKKPQTREKGHGVLFLSSKEHEVTKVESGQRYNCAVFLKYDDFHNTKGMI